MGMLWCYSVIDIVSGKLLSTYIAYDQILCRWIIHKNVLINFQVEFWLTPHYMLIRCSGKKLENV